MTRNEAEKMYKNIFGEVNDKHGYSITSKKLKNGVLVMEWYERNSFVDPKLERKVLFCNGKVYENHEEIATYREGTK